MRIFIFLITAFLVIGCKNDECETDKMPKNQESNGLIETHYFGFAPYSLDGQTCDRVIILARDSSFKYEYYVYDSLPPNINTDFSINYKGIIKVLDKSTVCTDQRSDPPEVMEYQYVEILYWELF